MRSFQEKIVNIISIFSKRPDLWAVVSTRVEDVVALDLKYFSKVVLLYLLRII